MKSLVKCWTIFLFFYFFYLYFKFNFFFVYFCCCGFEYFFFFFIFFTFLFYACNLPFFMVKYHIYLLTSHKNNFHSIYTVQPIEMFYIPWQKEAEEKQLKKAVNWMQLLEKELYEWWNWLRPRKVKLATPSYLCTLCMCEYECGCCIPLERLAF